MTDLSETTTTRINCDACGIGLLPKSWKAHLRTKRHLLCVENGKGRHKPFDLPEAGPRGPKRQTPLPEGEVCNYQKNPDKMKARQNSWRAANRERYNSYNREWYRKNKEARERKIKQMHNYRIKQRLKTVVDRTEGDKDRRL